MGIRNKEIHFVVSEEEINRIRTKMEEMEIRSLTAYLRKMALDGYCVKLELDVLKKWFHYFEDVAII